MTTWVLLAGLPGTGKSTLARALEQRLGGVTLDKDCVRCSLFPGEAADYTAEQDELCMDAMLAAAAYLTTHARVVFVFFDGRTFSRAAQIERVVRAAEEARARWRILHLTCTDAVAEQRLQADTAHPARNRSIELYRDMERRFEPIALQKYEIDTTHGADALMDAVLLYLLSNS